MLNLKIELYKKEEEMNKFWKIYFVVITIGVLFCISLISNEHITKTAGIKCPKGMEYMWRHEYYGCYTPPGMPCLEEEGQAKQKGEDAECSENVSPLFRSYLGIEK